jgi:hypothetical protein
MDIQSEKLKLIEWLTTIQDKDLIEMLKLFKDNLASGNDWWEALSASEKASIDRGLSDIENGSTIAHEDVMKKYGK